MYFILLRDIFMILKIIRKLNKYLDEIHRKFKKNVYKYFKNKKIRQIFKKKSFNIILKIKISL